MTQTKFNVSIAFPFPCFLLFTRETTEVIWPDLEPDLPNGLIGLTLHLKCVWSRQNHFTAEGVADIPI